ncbi:MAG: hypothetical protein HQL33_01565 [Alphaproteobacteria bacterium]|nr:hypothetical protein [Alphaproteobacteria bacterium]MBF0128657.1 hypothetical protein [Alphaproteobacteria bacterium]
MADFATHALPVVLQTIQTTRDLGFRKAAMDAGQAQADATAQNQLAALRATQEINQRQRQRDLAKAQAARRADFGAMGVSANGGSARAVLDGLTKAAGRDESDERRIADLRADEITAQQTARTRTNLLSYTAERDRRMLMTLSSIL